MERRLTAILAADVVAYSRLMGADEESTLSALNINRRGFDACVSGHGGRMFGSVGDSLMAEFASPVEAVRCAAEFQRELELRNADVPEDSRMRFRIGVNLGDVMAEGENLAGDGVNIAARLQAVAPPGGISISNQIAEQIAGKVDIEFAKAGHYELKNIARPVEVWTWPAKHAKPQQPRAGFKTDFAPVQRLVGVSLIFLVAIIAVSMWVLTERSGPGDAMAFPLPDKPSIAVLPFGNLSETAGQEYFADGMTEDLITDLSKISGLFVISRNSSFAFRDATADTSAVARALGVRFILGGSVRRVENQVRINVRLVDGLRGDLVWAERYDREYGGILAIQDDVIAGIVNAMAVELTDDEQSQISALPTENLEAYDYYLKAERQAYYAETGSAGEALKLYQRAISLDRGFAEAYAGYARVAVDILSFGYFDNLPSAVARKRAFEAASRAIQLKPGLARSFSVLALLQMLEGNHSDALNSAQKAVELAPNDAEAKLNLAVVLIYAGRHEDALREFETLQRLNPKPPEHVREYHALALFLVGRDEDSLAQLRLNTDEIASDLGLEVLAGANARLGNAGAASEAVASIIKRLPESSVEGFRTLYSHHRRPEDLAIRTDALRLAGLPEWPMGFVGDPAARLPADAVEAVIDGQTWSGERDGVGAFVRYVDDSGAFLERGLGYQMSGTLSQQNDLLCTQSTAIAMGRKFCGPVYRSMSDGTGESIAYSYPNGFGLYHFTLEY
ncbi:MAG: tetratricopeptide repeat protein [Rhodobacteraceae bacterium]|nr:tetratricopeptide repeat protein [Paracoccaceae bacterium]